MFINALRLTAFTNYMANFTVFDKSSGKVFGGNAWQWSMKHIPTVEGFFSSTSTAKSERDPFKFHKLADLQYYYMLYRFMPSQ